MKIDGLVIIWLISEIAAWADFTHRYKWWGASLKVQPVQQIWMSFSVFFKYTEAIRRDRAPQRFQTLRRIGNYESCVDDHDNDFFLDLSRIFYIRPLKRILRPYLLFTNHTLLLQSQTKKYWRCCQGVDFLCLQKRLKATVCCNFFRRMRIW